MLLLVLLATPTVQAADRPAADPLAVPKGGPEDQVAFIEALKKLKPTDPEMQAKVRDAALKSAERILAAKPNSEQLLFAVQTKAAILKDPQELTAFEEKLRRPRTRPRRGSSTCGCWWSNSKSPAAKPCLASILTS